MHEHAAVVVRTCPTYDDALMLLIWKVMGFLGFTRFSCLTMAGMNTPVFWVVQLAWEHVKSMTLQLLVPVITH